MKKSFFPLMLAFLFVMWSCSDAKDKKIAKDDTEETSKKKNTSDDEESNNEESIESQSDPADVVRMIFKAAKNGDYASVSGICAGDADGDAKAICELEDNAERRAEFKEYFSKGRVVGEPEIEGNEARVNIKFGPDGEKDETMVLTRKGKKWYLSNF
jgi:hypothetical protein